MWGPESRQDPDLARLLNGVENLASRTIERKRFDPVAFGRVLAAAGMGLHELHRLFVGKLTLNLIRQANGYLEGHYQKDWFGREDNEHLAEVLQNMEGSENLEERVRADLEARYRRVLGEDRASAPLRETGPMPRP